MAIHGSLKEMNVLETLQLVGAQRRSTTLRFTRGNEAISLHLREGQLLAYSVVTGDAREPFLDALVALGHASPVDTIELRRCVKDEGQDPWTLALHIPHLQRTTCAAVYQAVLEATLDRLVLWDRGNFTMHPLGLTTQAFDPSIAIDTLLLDTMRRLDELAAWREGEFAPTAVPCLADEGARGTIEAAAPDAIARAVLRQMDGRKNIEEIVRAMPLGDHAVYQVIVEGYEQGLVRILSYREAPAAAPQPAVVQPREFTGSGVATLVVLAGVAALAAVGSTVMRERILLERHAARARDVQWAEADVERALEACRFRTGAYPGSLSDLAASGVPLPRDAARSWSYQSHGERYALDPVLPGNQPPPGDAQDR